MAISERVVIRADDLLNWCDDTISWTYGLRANTLLDATIKDESIADKNNHDDNSSLGHNTGHHSTTDSNDVNIEEFTSTNIRSLKNSKLDFDEVEKEKGKQRKNQNFSFVWLVVGKENFIYFIIVYKIREKLNMLLSTKFTTQKKTGDSNY